MHKRSDVQRLVMEDKEREAGGECVRAHTAALFCGYSAANPVLLEAAPYPSSTKAPASCHFCILTVPTHPSFK